MRYSAILAFLFFGIFVLQSQTFENIDVHEAKALIEQNAMNTNFTILDVRTPGEYLPEHIEGAFMRDFYETNFEEQIDSLDKSREYLIYCRSGNRSGQAFNMMQNLGFTTVYNMLGGMNSWNAAGYPVTDVIPPFVDIYANTSGVFDKFSKVDFELYPNPASESISLNFDNSFEKGNFNILIFNNLGQEVLRQENTFQTSIDISGFEPGLFMIVVLDSKENVGIQSFIKQ